MMKEKGFTLIELLAVIVILAIIALIATPIILNIITDSKNSADLRSKEMYLHGVELALANKNVTENFEPTTCTVKSDGNLTCDVGELMVETKGSKPKEGGTITFKDGKITGNTLEFGTSNNEEEKRLCNLVEGNSKEIGSKYTCTLDEERTFYVLENNESSDTITLLMNRNYTDLEVPVTMKLVGLDGESFDSNGLNPYIEKVQTKFGNKVVVGIPSKEQMEGIGCAEKGGDCPQWAYDYLNGTPNSVTGVDGYWTSTRNSGTDLFWVVINDSSLYCSSWNVEYGLRPIITISKSLLS